MSVETQTHIGCLVINLVCGKVSKGCQDEVEHHLHHCGVEWTCARQKALWNIALHLRNGDRDSARAVCRENSIAYHKNTGYPKGCWGVVVRRFVEARKPSVIRRYAAVLRFYTSLRLNSREEPTAKQKAKAYSSITSGGEWLDDPEWKHQVSLLSTLMAKCLKGRLELHPAVRDIQPVKPGDKYADGLKAMSYYYSPYDPPQDLRGVPYSRMTMSFISTEFVPGPIDWDTPCYEMREVIRKQGYKDGFAGRVVILQEQGCKARVVTQPNAWCQLAFMPYHKSLARVVQQLYPRESCLEDQTSGAYAALDHISKGLDVYSVDLSSATDRFPRLASLSALRDALPQFTEYCDAIEEYCQQPLRCDFAPEGHVTYSVGQPMGLYSSFPLFHLSNLACGDVAVVSAKRYGYQPIPFSDGSYFKVLGDDIIFSDATVARGYRNLMAKMRVQISEHKSFEGKVAEFAGFIVVPTRDTVTCFRPYKVPDGDTITNPLEFVHGLGVSVKNGRLSKWWHEVFAAYSATMSSRDIALKELLAPSSDHQLCRSSFRGDNHLIISLSNRISMEMEDLVRLGKLPDLGGDTKINRIPLFRERGMFDWYGYDEDQFRKEEVRLKSEPFRTVPRRVTDDPLVRDYLTRRPGRRLVSPKSHGDPYGLPKKLGGKSDTRRKARERSR